MSIWCSHQDIGWDDLAEDTSKPNGGEVRSYASGWSNHYPTTDGNVEQPASVGVSTLPTWCVPGHENDYSEGVGPWLRMHVLSWKHDYCSGGKPTAERDSAWVVMDPDAARALAAELLAWAEREHVQPRGGHHMATGS